jgi:hypothetical protein
VQAIARGEVERVVNSPQRGFSGYGRSVVVRLDDGVRVLYAHLGSISVVVGQWLAAGETLGTVGADCGTVENPSARCRGPHVHVELASGAYPQRTSETGRIDPRSYAPMPDTPRAPSTTTEDDAERWVVLNRLINQLYLAVPADRRAGEPTQLLEAWRREYRQASTMGGDARRERLTPWITKYNDARNKLSMLGLDVPPRARDRTLLEEAAQVIDEALVQPAKDVASVAVTGLVIGGLIWLWLESKKTETVTR